MLELNPVTELEVREEVSLKLPFPELTDEQFFEFCAAHSEHRIERNAKGKIIIMPGTGAKTGNRNASLTAQLCMWAISDSRGVAFDSSTIFRLPNTAMRALDAAWVGLKRISGLSQNARERFLPFAPDFLVELTSPSDTLSEVKAKMKEWMENGCQLGWLIHVAGKSVYVYRAGGKVELLNEPESVSGDGPVEGFTLKLSDIWNPGW